MTTISIGDLARAFQLRYLTTGLKTDLNRLSRELATGLKAELATPVSRDYAPIAGIERALQTAGARKTATNEAASLSEQVQLSLEAVQDIGRELTPALLTAASTRDVTLNRSVASDVRGKFASVISALNTSLADRSILAGAATDAPALVDAENMLAQLTAATAGETTASGVMAALNTWFDAPGGGFETAAYLGSINPIGPLSLGEGESIAFDVRADHPAIRETLKALAASALVAEGVLSGNVEEEARLIELSGLRLVNADGPLTALRTEVGMVEARVEEAAVRNQAEKSALEITRTELIGVDPYEAASELEAAYSQLETLYTVTSHLSRLSFTDYMR